MKREGILIVEDNASFAFVIESQLRDNGYEAFLARSAEEALEILSNEEVHLIVSDLIMPVMTGQELLRSVRGQGYDVPFIIVTAHGSVETAVEAMKSGAFDYLKKDCTPGELMAAITRALEFGRLSRENKKYREDMAELYSFQSIVTRSASMTRVLQAAEKVAESPRTTITIYGESGVGKEVLAQAIHFAGGCLPTSFVAVNCAAIPDTLLETELFGHVKGAFTGAEKDRDGKFAAARGGTLLLDEVGDMPLNLQAKLLRVLENRTYEKIGSNREFPADFRVIAATHRHLENLVHQGNFREDLYHRLNVFPIVIPPLRERKEDIPLLSDHFLTLFRRHLGKLIPGISRSAMEALTAYDWPGNVRELRNCLERAVILTGDELLRPEHLSIVREPKTANGGSAELRLVLQNEEFSLEAVIREALKETLKRCNGNKSLAAQRLKINRKMFNRKNLLPED